MGTAGRDTLNKHQTYIQQVIFFMLTQ